LKPDLILVATGAAQQTTVADVAVINPLAATNIELAASVPGGASAAYELTKVTKYSSLCVAQDWAFTPIIYETLGGFGPSAAPLLSALAMKWGFRWDILPSRAKPIAMQRLACTMARAVGRTLSRLLDNDKDDPSLMLRADGG